MEKKPIRDCHKVCDGCELGKLKAELTAESNDLRAKARQKLADESSRQKADFELRTERTIARHGGDSYPAAEVFRNMATEAARLIDANIENYEEKLPDQEVVCDQDGPTRILGRCGARAVNITR